MLFFVKYFYILVSKILLKRSTWHPLSRGCTFYENLLPDVSSTDGQLY